MCMPQRYDNSMCFASFFLKIYIIFYNSHNTKGIKLADFAVYDRPFMQNLRDFQVIVGFFSMGG